MAPSIAASSDGSSGSGGGRWWAAHQTTPASATSETAMPSRQSGAPTPRVVREAIGRGIVAQRDAPAACLSRRMRILAALLVLAAAPAAAHADMTLDGRGFGHGVGMSQYGARGFAEREGR